MNKRILVTALATIFGVCAVSASAFAQQATNSQTTTATSQTATTQPVTTQTVASPPVAKTNAQNPHAVSKLNSRNCVRNTGSLIPPRKGRCLPVAGRSYSQQDIQRTGAPNVGRALQMLDPSVRVGGGH